MSDEWIIVDRHLYLTEDGCRVVEENSPQARWLHWAKGARVKRAEYNKMCKPAKVVELPKQAAPAPNKSRKPSGNK